MAGEEGEEEREGASAAAAAAAAAAGTSAECDADEGEELAAPATAAGATTTAAEAAAATTEAATLAATTAATAPVTAVLEAARRASAVVSGSDATARRRWAALPDDGLAREVEACRRDIRALAAALAALGGTGAGNDDEGAGAAVAAATITTEAAEEEEPATVPAAAAAAAAAGAGAGAVLAGRSNNTGRDAPHPDQDDPHHHPNSNPSEWHVPPHCIPIHANVTTFDWAHLASAAQFDVVMMDPPWQLATANPTRGVALGYSQLTDADITSLPVPDLQRRGGFLFVWVINAKYKFTLDLFDAWGYTLVDEIVWVKSTVNRRLAKSHGYYLQHAKETCLVAFKGAAAAGAADRSIDRSVDDNRSATDDRRRRLPIDPMGDDRSVDPAASAAAVDAPLPPPPMPWEIAAASRLQKGGSVSSVVGSDVIFSERRGQSQKPEEVYELVEALVPNGRYLELFARKNNLRDFWTSIGNEVTGTGLPPEDMAAMAAGQVPEGAVYGRAPG